jgi:uncharacterized protein (TIGR02246 family)
MSTAAWAPRCDVTDMAKRAPTKIYATLCAFLLGAILCAPLAAADATLEIKAALSHWMENFNSGTTDKVCDLFAPDVRADVRGTKERDHAAICDLLVRSLKDETKHYSYAMDIKEVLVFDDVAVVRLVWTLTIKQKDGKEIKSVEPGMDIFQKRADGSWKIIRYLAYDD